MSGLRISDRDYLTMIGIIDAAEGLPESFDRDAFVGLAQQSRAISEADMSRGYLQITFVDVKADEFRCLGGAGFLTMAETRQRFRDIPTVPDSDYILELCDRDMDVLEDKCISRETAEALLGAVARPRI